jgi:transcription elongation factor Elf1
MKQLKLRAADRLDRGIECLRCGCRHFWVVYTRPRNNVIVRLRECRHCGKRLLTREQSVGAGSGVPQV